MKKLTIKTENGKIITLENVVEFSFVEQPEKWWKNSIFDPHTFADAYYIDANGTVELNEGEEDNKHLNDFGNCSSDRKYMEKRSKHIKLHNLLSNFAEVVNEGWKPNWEDLYDLKWFASFDHRKQKWVVVNRAAFEDLNTIYFKNKKLAERAIEEIILPIWKEIKESE